LGEDGGLETERFVALAPGVGDFAFTRSGVGELGAEGGEIAGDAIWRDGAGGFDGDVFAGCAEAAGQLGSSRAIIGSPPVRTTCDAGWRRVSARMAIEGKGFAFGLPGRVFGVAPGAAEVAAGSADEDGGDAGELAFALEGVEDFGDAHQTFTGRAGSAGVLAYSVGSGTPATRKASRRSTQVPHSPQWITPPT